jgi:hypothetical protein
VSPLAFGQDIRCSGCHGKGAILNGRLECPMCHGTGVYHRPESEPPPPFEVGMAASEAAADHKWTPIEAHMVASVIALLAQGRRPFTADDIWAELPADFPVTKGLASALNAQVRAGIIVSTGRTITSKRKGEHGHAQRLTVWSGV